MHKFYIFLKCFRIVFFINIMMLLSACTYVQHTPVPEQLVDQAEVPQFAGVRTWADDLSPEFERSMNERRAQIRKSGLANKPLYVLALSGGGENGAFGAGVLNGWSARGTRPEFEIVTGVSTGALIAPLAFLGRDYDEALKNFYTSISTSNVLVANPVGGLLGGSALASNSPLAKMIAKIVDMEFLGKIATQHNRGRRLLVVTTNLEAQRPVLWSMGKIAAQDTPEALALFRSLLLASSAIPGAFPPVALKVEADGKFYTELQVDGGTTANSFVAPLNAVFPKHIAKRKKFVFVVQDGKLSPSYKDVKPQTLKIAGRAIGTLLKYKNYADIRRLYLLARKNGASFRMISIPDHYNRVSKEPFDKAYMGDLYNLGYRMGQSGSEWVTKPEVF
jgi:predicted acylesterase/phospholipase RssA